MSRLRRATDSVRVRVTFVATLLVAVVLVVGAMVLTHAVESRLVNQRHQVATAAASFGATQAAAGVPIDAINAVPFDQAAGIGVFNVTTGQQVGPRSSPFPAVKVLQTGDVTPAAIAIVGGPSRQDFTLYASPVKVGQGDFLVIGAASLAEVRRSIHTLWSSLRIGIPIVVLAVALVAWFLAGRALRPVEALRREVESISATTLQRRVPEPHSHDEVARLARTMNSMLGRLQASRDHERQFLSDASHELRSPLASMRAQLDTGAWPSHVVGVRAEARRLSHIVDDLMDLAKAEEVAAPTAEVDVEDVLREEVMAIRATASAEIDCPSLGAARVVGDRPALARLVRNLLDNAVRHAESRVEVGLSSDGSQVAIAVDDDGPGVAEADRQTIFERFARTDDSRSRDTGGVGLGLAVVRSTARRHGGDVRCEPSALGGARFVVTLPPADQ